MKARRLSIGTYSNSVGDPKSNVAPSFGPAVFGKPVPAQNPNGMVEGRDES